MSKRKREIDPTFAGDLAMVPEYFVDAVRVDDHGTWKRLVFASTYDEGAHMPLARRVVINIVVPSEALTSIARTLLSPASASLESNDDDDRPVRLAN